MTRTEAVIVARCLATAGLKTEDLSRVCARLAWSPLEWIWTLEKVTETLEKNLYELRVSPSTGVYSISTEDES